LLTYAAFIAPEPIPLFLFNEALQFFRASLSCAFERDIEEAVAALRAFALVERGSAIDERDSTVVTDVIRAHRLVRHVAAGRCDSATRECSLRVVLDAVASIYPKDVWNNESTWPRARRLDGIALALVDDVAVFPDAGGIPAAELLTALAYFRYGALADYEKAKALFEQALSIREKSHGLDHSDTATSINDLGRLLQTHGDLDRAQSLFERALTIREKISGSEHPDTATTLNDLGRLLRRREDLVRARPLIERALAIRQKAFGEDSPEAASCLINLGQLLKSKGNLSGARPLLERGVEITLARLGPGDNHTLGAMGTLAASSGEGIRS